MHQKYRDMPTKSEILPSVESAARVGRNRSDYKTLSEQNLIRKSKSKKKNKSKKYKKIRTI